MFQFFKKTVLNMKNVLNININITEEINIYD